MDQRAPKSCQRGAVVRPRRLPFFIFVEFPIWGTLQWFTCFYGLGMPLVCTKSIKIPLHEENLSNYMFLINRTRILFTQNWSKGSKKYKNGARVRPRRLPFSIFVEH